jgi:ribosomal protein S12 methylthiotransferase accessory factor
MKPHDASYVLTQLMQSHGGLIRAAPIVALDPDIPRITVRNADLGDVSAVWPEAGKRGPIATRISASGSGLDPDEALLPTLAEALERYSTGTFSSDQFIWASADELGGDALDLDSLPRCSTTELAHSKCPLRLAEKTQRIRWVRGVSLLDGRISYIPAVLVYSHAGYAVPAERFWFPISTGCAAHTCYERAILTGIYEVIERDAISIVWLQQLPLPRIELDCLPAPLDRHWERCLNASADIEFLFFHATSDLGVPVVYGLQRSPQNKRATTLVACATALTASDAICKVIRDLGGLTLSMRGERQLPNDWDDFIDPLHGASYMAQGTVSGAFDFLTRPLKSVRLSDIQTPKTEEYGLPEIVRTLRRLEMATYAVDLSTDEAIRAGVRVVRVIIPALQPLSFRYRARFLGHPRLYSAPAAMGYPSRSEPELNPWPQPFA